MEMSLKVLLPFRVFADLKNVNRIVAETNNGCYGFLPRRLDCVVSLVPGIFTYETEKGAFYLAVDQGTLVKAGTEVLVSVRDAVSGPDLGKLRESVEKEFLNLDEAERNTRSVMAKLESNFIHSFEKLRKE